MELRITLGQPIDSTLTPFAFALTGGSRGTVLETAFELVARRENVHPAISRSYSACVPIQNQTKPSEVSFASSRSNVQSRVRSSVLYWRFTRTDQRGSGASRVASEEALRSNPSRLPRLE